MPRVRGKLRLKGDQKHAALLTSSHVFCNVELVQVVNDAWDDQIYV